MADGLFDDLLTFVVCAAHVGDLDQLRAALETAARRRLGEEVLPQLR